MGSKVLFLLEVCLVLFFKRNTANAAIDIFDSKFNSISDGGYDFVNDLQLLVFRRDRADPGARPVDEHPVPVVTKCRNSIAAFRLLHARSRMANKVRKHHCVEKEGGTAWRQECVRLSKGRTDDLPRASAGPA